MTEKLAKKHTLNSTKLCGKPCDQNPEGTFPNSKRLVNDHFHVYERAQNPLTQDLMFQKMNEAGIVDENDLDSLFDVP